MEKNGTRPQRIAPDEIDSAVDEALQRVEQGKDLSEEELKKVNGGSLPIDTRGGMLAK